MMELARRHCLNMVFTEAGGRGIAELENWLPINARQVSSRTRQFCTFLRRQGAKVVSCPVAADNAWGSNLDVIAGDFYDRHCAGCQLRRPTGERPNLA